MCMQGEQERGLSKKSQRGLQTVAVLILKVCED